MAAREPRAPLDPAPTSDGGLDADLRLSRGEFTLDVRLTCPPGKVLALLGPNGAGKTTLMRAITGMVPVNQGRVTVTGADQIGRAHV